MFLIKLGLVHQNLVRKFEAALKLNSIFKLNFHEVECTLGHSKTVKKIFMIKKHYFSEAAFTLLLYQ